GVCIPVEFINGINSAPPVIYVAVHRRARWSMPTYAGGQEWPDIREMKQKIDRSEMAAFRRGVFEKTLHVLLGSWKGAGDQGSEIRCRRVVIQKRRPRECSEYQFLPHLSGHLIAAGGGYPNRQRRSLVEHLDGDAVPARE